MADKIPRSGAVCHNYLSLSIAVQRREAPRRENGWPQWLNEMDHYLVIPPRALSQGRAEAWQRREELPEQKKKEKEKQREARSASRGKRAVQGRARSRARSRETSSERREQQREGRSRVRGLPTPLRVFLPHPLLPPPSTPPPPRHLKDLHGTYAQSPIYGIEEAKEDEEESDWVDEEEEGRGEQGRGEGEGARNQSFQEQQRAHRCQNQSSFQGPQIRTQPKDGGRRTGRAPRARAMERAAVASPILLPLLPLREAAVQKHHAAVAQHEAAVAAMQGAYGAGVTMHEAVVAAM